MLNFDTKFLYLIVKTKYYSSINNFKNNERSLDLFNNVLYC